VKFALSALKRTFSRAVAWFDKREYQYYNIE